MALSVPLSRFTSQVGGGSAFYVRPHRVSGFCGAGFRCGVRVSSPIVMRKLSVVRLSLARAGFEQRASRQLLIYEHFDSPMFVWDRHVDVA